MTTYTSRNIPSTSYASRTLVSTSYESRSPVMIDLGYLLNEANAILCDENGNRILFNTGIFYPGDTPYTSRIIPA